MTQVREDQTDDLNEIVPREIAKVRAAIFRLDDEIIALREFSQALSKDLMEGLPESSKVFEFQ